MLISMDAAIFSGTAKAGYGAVMRNHLGVMHAACRGVVDHVHCPEIAEAEAICQALMLAESIGVQYFFSKLF